VMDKIRVKYPVIYEKAVDIGQILTRKMDKLTPESRPFVMEVLHKSSVTPSFFARESELTNEKTVEVVKKFLKLSEESKGYIRAYFPRMTSLIWRVINRYYVRGQEKELRN
ncbi:hypothetical protein PRIPAC_97914, partial [Pristionchus pacificus]|uniref:Uncharacterized protein n=1 Tax=Pristionchus pacificus TaxID=54126 RepID=A0A2A6BXM6_PRIPA